MIPMKTKTTDLLLGAPRDWDESKLGECKALPVCAVDGVIYSYWRLSVAERIKIFFGSPLRLAIFSERMPPVELSLPDKKEI